MKTLLWLAALIIITPILLAYTLFCVAYATLNGNLRVRGTDANP